MDAHDREVYWRVSRLSSLRSGGYFGERPNAVRIQYASRHSISSAGDNGESGRESSRIEGARDSMMGEKGGTLIVDLESPEHPLS